MLGYEPIVETMVLIDGQDFTHFFGTDTPFTNGTTLTLKIYSRDDGSQIGSWPAVSVKSGGASVQITSDDLDVIPDASSFRVYVQYPDGQDLCWYRGRVWRRT